MSLTEPEAFKSKLYTEMCEDTFQTNLVISCFRKWKKIFNILLQLVNLYGTFCAYYEFYSTQVSISTLGREAISPLGGGNLLHY